MFFNGRLMTTDTPSYTEIKKLINSLEMLKSELAYDENSGYYDIKAVT